MTATKRRHYRVTGDDLNGIHVSMLLGRDPNPVHLIDISAAGAAIAFLNADRGEVESLLRTGPTTPLVRIESTRLAETLDIACRVAHLQEVDAGVVCGVAFLRRVDETTNLDRALLKVFNRRGAVRVEPDVQQPIAVSVTSPSGASIAEGTMRDLSLTGIGVTIQPEAMSKLPTGAEVVARFSLNEHPLALRATVRFGTLRTAQIPVDGQPATTGIVGIEFDPDARAEPSCRKALSNWVMRRQLEIQRIQREAAAAAASR